MLLVLRAMAAQALCTLLLSGCGKGQANRVRAMAAQGLCSLLLSGSRKGRADDMQTMAGCGLRRRLGRGRTGMPRRSRCRRLRTAQSLPVRLCAESANALHSTHVVLLTTAHRKYHCVQMLQGILCTAYMECECM